MKLRTFAALLCAPFIATSALAAVVDVRYDIDNTGANVDGTLGTDEYGAGNSYSFTGGGTGFGGALGNGTLYMQSDGTNLYFGFQPGNNLNDVVAIFLNTRPGGVTDTDMNDTADGSRRVLSNLGAAGDEGFPFLADFGITISEFGFTTFELNAGTTAGHLNFLDFSGTFTGKNTNFREYSLPLATLGLSPGAIIELFVAYASDSNFLSNETIPAMSSINSGGNPGDTSTVNFEDFNQFVVAVPEPSTYLLLIIGAAGVACLRRFRSS